MEKSIPPNSVDWFCGKDFLHDALPCSGFNAQARWLFSSPWSSLSVVECASGLDDGHEFTAGLCDGPGAHGVGGGIRLGWRSDGKLAAEDSLQREPNGPRAWRGELVCAQAAESAGRNWKYLAG